MEDGVLTPDLTVDDVISRWPETAVVFREYADACVGCDLAAFCTVADAAREYDTDIQELMNALTSCIAKE